MAETRPARLSLTDCRRLLGPGVDVEDCELERERDRMYALADVALDMLTQPDSRKVLPMHPRPFSFMHTIAARRRSQMAREGTVRRLNDEQVEQAERMRADMLEGARERFAADSPKRLSDVEGVNGELAGTLEAMARIAECRLRVSADASRIGCYRVGMAGATWVDANAEGIATLVETMHDWMARDVAARGGAA